MIQLAPAQRSRMVSVALRALSCQRTWRPWLASTSLISTGKVPVAAELGDDLPIQPALVVFDRQE
jgi:hypothetical protein